MVLSQLRLDPGNVGPGRFWLEEAKDWAMQCRGFTPELGLILSCVSHGLGKKTTLQEPVYLCTSSGGFSCCLLTVQNLLRVCSIIKSNFLAALGRQGLVKPVLSLGTPRAHAKLVSRMTERGQQVSYPKVSPNL